MTWVYKTTEAGSHTVVDPHDPAGNRPFTVDVGYEFVLEDTDFLIDPSWISHYKPADPHAYVPGSSEWKPYVSPYSTFIDPTPTLASKCWICQKDITVSHYKDFEKIHVTLKCCKREQKISLTKKQIEESNAQGVYWAFMV